MVFCLILFKARENVSFFPLPRFYALLGDFEIGPPLIAHDDMTLPDNPVFLKAASIHFSISIT